MEEKKNEERRFVFCSKDGDVLGITFTSEEIKQVTRLMEANPEKYEAGTEGVLKACEELKNEGFRK